MTQINFRIRRKYLTNKNFKFFTRIQIKFGLYIPIEEVNSFTNNIQCSVSILLHFSLELALFGLIAKSRNANVWSPMHRTKQWNCHCLETTSSRKPHFNQTLKIGRWTNGKIGPAAWNKQAIKYIEVIIWSTLNQPTLHRSC